MAKPLGVKARLIREALRDYPDVGNKDLAERLSAKAEGFDIKPSDIAAQKMALKKLAAGSSEPDEEDFEEELLAAEPAPEPLEVVTRTAPGHSPAKAADPLDLIDEVFILARKCGGIERLKRLVDRLADR